MTDEEIKSIMLSKSRTPIDNEFLEILLKNAKKRMKLENISLEQVLRTTFTVSEEPPSHEDSIIINKQIKENNANT